MSTLTFSSASPRRPLGHFVALLAVLLALLMAFTAAEWDVAVLIDPARRAEAAGRVWAWLSAFASPDLSAEFLGKAWTLTQETVAVAVLGMAFALVLAIPLALGASRQIAVGPPGEGGRFWRMLAHLMCAACRLVLDVLRAVPDFVWAVLLVALVGLGPLTGALALGLNVAGILAKVYSELWDAVPAERYAQVRSLGGGRLATFLYGIRPLAARNLLSFTLMRAECAVRNAAVIGAVGGGGLGAEIWYQIRFGAWDKVSTLIVCTLLLTITVDLLSGWIRRQLRADSHGLPRRRPLGPWAATGTLMGVLLLSIWYLGWGNASADGQVRNHLAPLAELWSGEAWQKLAFFERLLRPELDLAAIGIGSPEALEKRALDERPWLVWRAIESAAIPLAMAVVGTLLGMAMAIALSYSHSVVFQRQATQLTGERIGLLRWLWRWLSHAHARFAGLLARGVPEVMWAFLLIAFFGAGLMAGMLAIALHTFGVLIRIYGESIDNLSPRVLQSIPSGSRPAMFLMGAMPRAWRDWLTYGFFQFESNVRAAVVLGVVGVGGLGFQFTFNFEWFRFERAGTYLAVMILLTIIIDRLSRLMKLSRPGH